MTRQGTTAKCLAHSTMLSLPLSLDSHQNPGQTLAPKPPSATWFSKISMPSSTTMPSATPYLPAKMVSTNPSCSQVIVPIWLKCLPNSHSFWSELMSAPHTSSTQCGVRTMMHVLLLADHTAIFPSFVGASFPCPRLQLIQSTSGQWILNNLFWIPNCKALTTFPPPSKPYYSTPMKKSPTLVSQSHWEQPWQNSQPTTFKHTSHPATQTLKTKQSNGSATSYSTIMSWMTWLALILHSCCLRDVSTMWTPCPVTWTLSNLTEIWETHLFHALPIMWNMGFRGCLINLCVCITSILSWCIYGA